MDASDAFRVADAVEARYTRLEQNLKNFGKLNFTGTASLDRDLNKVLDTQRKILQLQTEQARTQTQTQRGFAAVERTKQQELVTERQQLATQRERVRLAQQELRLRQQQEQASRRSTTGGANGVIAGISGLQAGVAAIGGYAVISIAERTLELANEQTRANRILASSAIEAGRAFASAAEDNKKFADQVGLSERQAATTTGAILRLAARTGRPEQSGTLLTGFADLGAAFGIQSQDLQTLIGTILSGQDEGLNRLGIADPGQLYRQYAQEIGKTSDQLTQFEKTQAAVNAVMQKAGMFSGTATARMNSLEGQTAKLSASWDKLTSSGATWLTQQPLVSDAIRTYTDLFGALAINIDQVNKGLSEGKTPSQIVDELKPGAGFFDYLRAGVSGIPAGFALGADLLSGEGLDASVNRFGAAIDPSRISDRDKQALRDQVSNQKKLNEDNAKAAEAATAAQKKQIEAEQARTAELERQSKLITQINEQIVDPKATVQSLTNLRDGLDQALPKDKLEEINKNIDKAINANIEKAVEQVKSLEAQFQGVFDQLQRAENTTNPFVAVILDAEAAMKKVREQTAGLTDDLKRQAEQMQQNVNAMRLFEQRADTRLQAYDLLSQAQDIRDPFSSKERDRITAKATRDFLARNPNYIGVLEQEYENRRRDSSDPLSYNGETFEQFMKQDLEKRMTVFANETPEQKARKRLDDQLRILQGLGASNEAERSAVNRRIISISQGLNYDSLDSGTRDVLATAREQEAERLLKTENEAMDIARESRDYLKAISENQTRLLAVAQRGGTASIDAELKITGDGAPGAVQVNQIGSPTPANTREFYDFGGFSLAGGSNR